MWLYAATPLTTVRAIRALTPEQAKQGLPVQLKAVVTYYNPGDYVLFVADKTGPIFIQTTRRFSFAPGDLLLVRGVTAPSYHTNIVSNDLRVIRKAALPSPVSVTFSQLMAGNFDCSYVKATGRVLSATVQQTLGSEFLLMRVQMDGGTIDVHVNHPEGVKPYKLLDAQVALTGVAGAQFDGNFQVVGGMLHVSSPADMRITAPAPVDPAKLPLTSIPHILSSYNARRNPRLRIRGSVTLFEPGSQLVVESGGRAALVHTYQRNERNAVEIGDVVDVTGFANPNDYTESLNYGQYMPTPRRLLITPRQVTWNEAFSGKYAFDLISIDGRLMDEASGSSQDTLFIEAGGHVFSAILDHPGDSTVRLPMLHIGSTVRVTGVCFVQSGFAWHTPVSFHVRLRNPEDVKVLQMAPWWTVEHLLYIIGALVAFVLAALVWGALLRRRVYYQTQQIRRSMEFEAEQERRQAYLEKQRSRVLEAINSMLPLNQVLRMITRLISEQMGGVECRCEVARDTSPGASEGESGLEERRDILSSSGERLGTLVLAWKQTQEQRFGSELVEIGTRLAALAIDNRRLYESLIQRSEYDQLTEIPNRFVLESRLCDALAEARRYGHRFVLIYIDLDRFKSVNDRFGHRVGDTYLQHVARRLQEKLRAEDTLARVGGDEFIALIPVVADRPEAEEIAWRLESCFDSPFRIDAHMIEGSASVGFALFPDDGEDEEQIKRFADAAMYAGKQRASGLGLR